MRRCTCVRQVFTHILLIFFFFFLLTVNPGEQTWFSSYYIIHMFNISMHIIVTVFYFDQFVLFFDSVPIFSSIPRFLATYVFLWFINNISVGLCDLRDESFTTGCMCVCVFVCVSVCVCVCGGGGYGGGGLGGGGAGGGARAGREGGGGSVAFSCDVQKNYDPPSPIPLEEKSRPLWIYDKNVRDPPPPTLPRNSPQTQSFIFAINIATIY